MPERGGFFYFIKSVIENRRKKEEIAPGRRSKTNPARNRVAGRKGKRTAIVSRTMDGRKSYSWIKYRAIARARAHLANVSQSRHSAKRECNYRFN